MSSPVLVRALALPRQLRAAIPAVHPDPSDSPRRQLRLLALVLLRQPRQPRRLLLLLLPPPPRSSDR
jgi:hypothetical protein